MYERKMVEKWVVKFNPLVIELNRLLREIVAEEGITPEVWVYQDPEKIGKGIQAIEVTINPNPHYSEWTKLHIDYCRRFPKASAFLKLWMPTYATLYGWIYGMKVDVNIRTGKGIFRV
jgi:hypothetical protein